MLDSTPAPPDVYTYTISSRVMVATADFTLLPNISYAPPCCGFCNVWAANARVFYWPTPNPVPDITTVVDSTGFTLYATIQLSLRAVADTNITVPLRRPMFGMGIFKLMIFVRHSAMAISGMWEQS